MIGSEKHSFTVSLLAGAFAGTAVDLSLFPLDTVKTRLQSEVGFWMSGGFGKLYRGLGSAMIVSAPNAAAFFVVYQKIRNSFLPGNEKIKSFLNDAAVNLLAASAAETSACIVRVPMETIKQRSQATHLSGQVVFKQIINAEGVATLYRGFLSTLARDVPFALVQFPLWEYFKSIRRRQRNGELSMLDSSICGSASGLIAAILTNPMDVAKTQIMLARKGDANARINFISVIFSIYRKHGISKLFAGSSPRLVFITLGGFIYLGGYDKAASFLVKHGL